MDDTRLAIRAEGISHEVGHIEKYLRYGSLACLCRCQLTAESLRAGSLVRYGRILSPDVWEAQPIEQNAVTVYARSARVGDTHDRVGG